MNFREIRNLVNNVLNTMKYQYTDMDIDEKGNFKDYIFEVCNDSQNFLGIRFYENENEYRIMDLLINDDYVEEYLTDKDVDMIIQKGMTLINFDNV